MDFRYRPGPTGRDFLQSRKFLKLIIGPVGGGKSTVCLFDLLQRAVQQEPFHNVRRTKFLIIRNTMQQLMQTVKTIIDQWFVTLPQGRMGSWRLTDKVFEVRLTLGDGTVVFSEFCLLPADTPDDVRRLLSVECSGAWIEESREVVQEIFEGVQGRTMRFPNRASGGVTYPGVICSTNAPPMGTFWQELVANPPSNMEIFIQPPALLEDGSINPEAENLDNLDPNYYPNLIEGKSQDWIDVYLRNKFGAGGFGLPVFKTTFRRDFHVSKEPIKAVPVSNNGIVVGMDNGLTAAAVIGQQDMRGRLNIIGESYVEDGDSMGVETFLDKLLIPKLLQVAPVRRDMILFVLDPACFQRSQINEMTIAMAVAARGFKVMRACTNDPERRIAAVEGLLVRSIDGGPGLLVSSECGHIIQALDWGYRNKRTAAGVNIAQPEKNHFSHVADALQYLALHYNQIVHPAAGLMRTPVQKVKQVDKYLYV